MKNLEFAPLEKEMLKTDFVALQAQVETAKANIAKATTAADVKSEICSVWQKVSPYIGWAEKIPIVGKYFSLLADGLNTICPS